MVRGLDGYILVITSVGCSAVFKARRGGWFLPVSGGFGEGETPLPFPNRAVKPLSADGTWPFGPGRVGRRRFNLESRPSRGGSLSFRGELVLARAHVETRLSTKSRSKSH